MSDFERERDRLISEIAEASTPGRVSQDLQPDHSSQQNLAKCVTSVNQLNRNIENVTTVGAGFEPVHHLWKQFENVMGTSSAVSPLRMSVGGASADLPGFRYPGSRLLFSSESDDPSR